MPCGTLISSTKVSRGGTDTYSKNQREACKPLLGQATQYKARLAGGQVNQCFILRPAHFEQSALSHHSVSANPFNTLGRQINN